MTGTVLNVSTVLLGGTVGALAGGRLPDRFKQTAMHAVGLMTLLIGFQMALGTRSAIIVLGSVVVGGLLGEAARIEDGLAAFGERVEKWISPGGRGGTGSQIPTPAPEMPDSGVWDQESSSAGANHAVVEGKRGQLGSRFSKGFVTASLVFCVGPMTILGSFQDGLTGAYDTLAVKSVLDGFAAVALASSLGWGVVLSSLTVLIYQGALTLGAVWVKPLLSESVVTEMTAAGGLLIVGIGLNLLGLARIRVANMLPALVIAPVLVALVVGK